MIVTRTRVGDHICKMSEVFNYFSNCWSGYQCTFSRDPLQRSNMFSNDKTVINTGHIREPDKLRIFVNYALKTPEYECLSNFSRITYCCHFSAYARGFVLFRTYESRPGDAEFGR